MSMKKTSSYLIIKTKRTIKKIVLVIAVLACLNSLHGQDAGGSNFVVLTRNNNFSLLPDSASPVISPSDRESQVVSTIEELVTGRVSGIRTVKSDGSPGASYSLQLRGVRSFRGDNEPIYILDGVVLNSVWNDASNTFWNDPEDYQAAHNILSRINPNDIAKIEILKNADATAIYGNMGANGVILITTKSGSVNGFHANVQTNLGIATFSRKIDMLIGNDYLAYQNIVNPGNALPFQTGAPVDWQRDATRTAVMQNYYLDIGGGNDKMRYYISMGYAGNEGIVKGSDITQASIRVNLDRLIGGNSVFGTRMLFGYTENNMIQATAPYGSYSLTKLMTKAIPFESSADNNSIVNENPRNWIDGYDDNSVQYFATPQVYFTTNIFKWLQFKSVAGIDYRTKERLRWIGNEITRGRSVEGRAGRSNINAFTYNVDSRLNIRFISNKHSFTGLGGVSVNGEFLSNKMNEGTKFFNQDLRGVGIQLAENIFPYRNLDWNNNYLSGYVSGTYTFDQKYTLSATLRKDKTSNFDESWNDLDYYPSVGLSWNVMNEDFLSGQQIVSTLNVRGSWGRSGKQTILPLDLSRAYITGVSPELEVENGMTNYYDMRWNNINTQQNIGIDLGFSGDKITATIDLYNSDSDDRLQYYYHKRLGAYESVYTNEASVNNKGIEILLNAVLLKNSEIEWNGGASFAYNRNEITNTGADGDVFGSKIGELNENPLVVNINRKGEQVGAFWGYKTQGIVENQHLLFVPPFYNVRLQQGDLKFIDTNGDGNTTEEDYTIIGNPIPEYVFGFNTDVRYKNFTVQLIFEGAAKYDIANLNLLDNLYVSGNVWNIRENTFKDAYSGSNTNGKSPRFNAVGVKEFTSRVIEDGSYVRLSDFIVGYNLQLPMIKWINSVDLTFAARNLFLITKYSGYDPNVNSYSYNLSSIGIDNAAYPSARSFLLGVKVKF